MVNGRRSTYRRKGRRGSRTLTTRRIFNNKSAKAQAGQIYALKKRVNRMYNSLKPEVKVVESDAYNAFQFLPGTTTTWSTAMITPGVGNTDSTRIGSRIRIVKPTLFVSAKYNRITRTSGTAPIYNLNAGNTGAGIRLIAVQSKVPRNQAPALSSLLHGTISDSFMDIQTIPNLQLPFEVGISTEYHVLYDRTFYFSNDKPILSKRINFKPKMRHMDWDVAHGGDTSYTYPAGAIFWYMIQGGLSSLGLNLTDYDHDEIAVTYTNKLAFTDP